MSIPYIDMSALLAPDHDAYRDAFERVMQSGHFILGPEVAAFEQEIAAWLDVPHAIGVSSGTDALVIGLRILGIQPGDEVITTPFTFFATAEAILEVGATPVLVDVDPHTLQLDPAAVERAITPRTRGLLPVHLFGAAAPMGSLNAIARAHGLVVLEDTAQAFGGTDGERALGTLSDAGAYSFFPTKVLGAFGDAGLVTTADADRADHARRLRAHGAARKYANTEAGYNARLDALQAAILRVRLRRMDAELDQRRTHGAHYRALLDGVEGITLLPDTAGAAYNYFTVRVPVGRDSVREAMRAAGIATMVYYPTPLHQLPALATGQSLPHAERAAREVLSLPFWPGMSESIQAEVVETLARCVREVRESSPAS